MLQAAFDSSNKVRRRDSWNRRKGELNFVRLPMGGNAFQVVRFLCVVDCPKEGVVRLGRTSSPRSWPAHPEITKVERSVKIFDMIDWSRHGKGLSFRLGKPTGEEVFGINDANFKSCAPAGQASRGPLIDSALLRLQILFVEFVELDIAIDFR